MQSSIWDKSLISFIISPIVGILVMKGIISPDHADYVTQQADLWVGATIFLGGLFIGVLHHHTIQANQNEYVTEETEVHTEPKDGQLPIDQPVASAVAQSVPPVVPPAEQPAN